MDMADKVAGNIIRMPGMRVSGPVRTAKTPLASPAGWRHIDTKFGLSMIQAESHRKGLQIRSGVQVKKLLQNFKIKEWHFLAKVR